MFKKPDLRKFDKYIALGTAIIFVAALVIAAAGGAK